MNVAIRRILSPVTGKPDVMEVLLRSLKVESDLPSTVQTQALEISGHVDEISKRIRPELLEEFFGSIEAGSLSRSLAESLIPELSALLDSGLQELIKEEGRFSAITQKVEEAYHRVVEVQTPLAEFLSQKAHQQDTEIAERVEELKRFRDSLAAQKSSLEKLGEKISSTRQRLSRLKEQAARLASHPQPPQNPPS